MISCLMIPSRNCLDHFIGNCPRNPILQTKLETSVLEPGLEADWRQGVRWCWTPWIFNFDSLNPPLQQSGLRWKWPQLRVHREWEACGPEDRTDTGGLQETGRQEILGAVRAPSVPVGLGLFLPESLRERQGERMNYLTNVKSSDLLISKKKMGCASQFLGVNDPEYVPWNRPSEISLCTS